LEIERIQGIKRILTGTEHPKDSQPRKPKCIKYCPVVDWFTIFKPGKKPVERHSC
jgi:hypothetical protein